MFFIDCWSVGLDDIPRKQITPERILTILQREGRFSNFEATANQVIARAITAIVNSNLVETYRPASLKGSDGTLGPMFVSPKQACAS
ncbi:MULTISPECIES: hypothetical protein [unclassified Mesorhizobium]|uniref:hypothetical protein n=1 Tax=unclassified Mesorhizobium TaxID=325217 RepID=UPI000BAFB3D5|nr:MULTISPECIES: hypothetical protein [unclassified Mesorhizobium]MDG4853886.1 hypothetical protein [Mesorhizobium sp. WSM4982]MDG4915731.1 hypothetical protein [Mesorhizobium sp. WSM4983]PBB29737.1 hypothetical protein CK214_23480 [Mesorhizobium sp. WSM3882]RUV26286.1 hypothetical protein EOA91_05145 [Mesorhizobium sp. M1A.F.Ca.IN.022.04.1.1]RWG25587.1 MAG: hypothetical protein EOQ60_29295 [Mesorhizobium sp.]